MAILKRKMRGGDIQVTGEAYWSLTLCRYGVALVDGAKFCFECGQKV